MDTKATNRLLNGFRDRMGYELRERIISHHLGLKTDSELMEEIESMIDGHHRIIIGGYHRPPGVKHKVPFEDIKNEIMGNAGLPSGINDFAEHAWNRFYPGIQEREWEKRYHGIKTELPDGEKKSIALTRIADAYAKGDPSAYFRLITLDPTMSVMDDGSMFMYLGKSMLRGNEHSGIEFSRTLDGNIIRTWGLRPRFMENKQVYQQEVRGGLDSTIINLQEVMNNPATQSEKGWSYKNSITGASGEDAYRIDDQVRQRLVDKYPAQIAFGEDFVDCVSNGSVSAFKGVQLKPGFLNSFEGRHPLEAAQDLVATVKGMYELSVVKN